MVVYLVMHVNLPPWAWAIKNIEKIRRKFLWRRRKQARGGHCHVAWVKACHPPKFGGFAWSSKDGPSNEIIVVGSYSTFEARESLGVRERVLEYKWIAHHSPLA
jgi:hypothetical protein